MKKIYDCMKYSFLKNDIINIFIMEFNNIIETMEQIVQEKNNIEDDNQLKQFRREMVYMKKVLEMFDLINVSEYQERIENISKYVNPNKIMRKKKKVEKNESENYVESK
jgi:chemotaxis protein histidine kinase CheA